MYQKKQLREMKRQIKKDGNRSRRRHFQRQLQKNPEDAHWDEFEFKHNSSTSLNGLDLDQIEIASHSSNKILPI
jgi:hypothetical protein